MSFSNITNIYELLDQDGEEGVARMPAPKKEVAPAKSAPAKGAVSAPVKSAQQSSSNKGQREKGEGRQGDRSDRRDNNRPPRQNREDRAPRQQGGEQGETDRQPVEFARRDRPADRQQAREKGESRNDEYRRNAPAGGFVGNKRVFDRKSATGRGNGQGREDKRGGRGRGGWGANDGSDVAAEAINEIAKEGENIVQGEGVADNKGTDAAAEKIEEPAPETEEEKKKREEQEKEAKLVSWSDYQKQLAEKKSQSSVLSVAAPSRKANEGVDEKTAKKWSSMEQIKRDDSPAPAKTGEEAKKTESKKKTTVRLDELFTIKEAPKPQYNNEDGDRRRGGRGGNRGDRSDKRQGQGRGRGQQGAEVSFTPEAFPTLQ